MQTVRFSLPFQLAPVDQASHWTAEQFPILVMYPKGRHLSAKVRIFVDWVSELILQDPIFQTP